MRQHILLLVTVGAMVGAGFGVDYDGCGCDVVLSYISGSCQCVFAEPGINHFMKQIDLLAVAVADVT